jgi:hypothetical protein
MEHWRQTTENAQQQQRQPSYDQYNTHDPYSQPAHQTQQYHDSSGPGTPDEYDPYAETGTTSHSRSDPRPLPPLDDELTDEFHDNAHRGLGQQEVSPSHTQLVGPPLGPAAAMPMEKAPPVSFAPPK